MGNNPYESPFDRMLREVQEKKMMEEALGREALLGSLFAAPNLPLNPFAQAFFGAGLAVDTRRKIFISYHHGDDVEARAFVQRWTETEKIFIPKGLGLGFTDDIINSNNPDYVMSQIRKNYIDDASITIVLLGKCTHSRRYVDWEIKASLRQDQGGLPNGLMGIVLPSLGNTAYFPERLEANWNSAQVNCYAKCWRAPQSAAELQGWIEDAYTARTRKITLNFKRNRYDEI